MCKVFVKVVGGGIIILLLRLVKVFEFFLSVCNRWELNNGKKTMDVVLW